MSIASNMKLLPKDRHYKESRMDRSLARKSSNCKHHILKRSGEMSQEEGHGEAIMRGLVENCRSLPQK